MKNLLFIALLFASTAVFADSASATTPSTPPSQSVPGNGERFEQVKARILQHLQEKQACVQAATTKEALKVCMPHMGEHRGEGKGGGFGGGRFRNNGNNDNNGQSENAPGQQ